MDLWAGEITLWPGAVVKAVVTTTVAMVIDVMSVVLIEEKRTLWSVYPRPFLDTVPVPMFPAAA